MPEKLTDAEKQQTADAIKDLSVEIYTGADDRILRRMVINLGIAGPRAAARRAVGGRAVRPPAARPQRGPGHRGARGREAVRASCSGSSSGSGSGDLGALGAGAASGGGGAAERGTVEEYSTASQDAGSDNDKVRKCADLLTTP